MAGSIKNLKPNYNSRYENGYYVPKNKEKYKGDINNVIIRSSYEKRMCQICDASPSIIAWSSEPIAIRYISKVDGKTHNYWLDFWFKTKEGKEYIVEVKPNGKLKEPKKPRKKTKKAMYNYGLRLKEYLVNYSKFEAATEFAKQSGMNFIIAEEEFLKLK